jgi:hypothetical protein
MSAQRLQTPKDFADATVQINRAFEKINAQIAAAGGTGGVSAADFADLQAQVTTLTNLSGTGASGSGSPGPAGSGGITTVNTDGTTIGGDGVVTPIFLEVPVTIPDGGTGLVQVATQQITTSGNAILAGGYEAQTALTLAGVTTTSAAMWSLPNTPDASWLTGISVILKCTAGTVTMYLVNGTALPITPVAQAVNIKVIL